MTIRHQPTEAGTEVTLREESASRDYLRHMLATLVYRGSKTLRGASDSFADFNAGADIRTPVQILGHINDLLVWGLSYANGERKWAELGLGDWAAEVARFHASAQAFDDFLASDTPLQAKPERLFQGPIADALQHVGQLGMLRRMAGEPILGENFAVADIVPGQMGPDQPPPRKSFP